MTKQAAKDVFDEMTREDLVAWIKSHHFSRPERSDVLYLRWERQSAELLEEMQKENRALDEVDFKERDRRRSGLTPRKIRKRRCGCSG